MTMNVICNTYDRHGEDRASTDRIANGEAMWDSPNHDDIKRDTVKQ